MSLRPAPRTAVLAYAKRRRRADGGPVDDPFTNTQDTNVALNNAVAYSGALQSQDRRQQAAAGLQDAWQTFGAPVASAVTAPGDILAGKLTPQDPRFVDSAITAAGLATTGGMPFAEEGALGSAGGKLTQPPITAYHGSPHDFDQFSLGKIGSGEGSQAYGHGLYFAENEGVAKSYRDALAGRNLAGPEFHAASALAQYGDPAIAAEKLLDRAGLSESPAGERSYRDASALLKGGWKPPGTMYQVGINADPEHFLDWDKPLSEQSSHVQDALAVPPKPSFDQQVEMINRLKASGVDPGDLSSHPDFLAMQDALDKKMSLPNGEQATPDRIYGHSLYNAYAEGNGGDHVAAAQKLRGAGIPGIKYLDAGSRATGDGSRNLVVFDDKTIDILKKYGLAGLGLGSAGLAASSSSPSKAAERPGHAEGGPVKSPFLPLEGESPSTTSAAPDAASSPFQPLEDLSPPTAPPKATASAPSSPGILSNTSDESYGWSTAKNVATGAIKGAASSVTGGGIDALSDQAIAGLIHWWTGEPFDQVMGKLTDVMQFQNQAAPWSPPPSELNKQVEGAILNRTGEYQPTTPEGRIQQAAAAATAGIVTPGYGMPGFRAGLKMAPAAAVAGGTAQGVTDLTGSELAGLAAGVVVPGAADALASSKTARLMTKSGRQGIAGEGLVGASSDPEATKQWAAAGAQPEDTLVPGSKPTTFQVTGDQGIGQLERQARTAAPADFLQRNDEQNAARVQALGSVETQGHPQDLADFVTGRMRSIDDMSQAYLDAATKDAQDKAAAIGPGLSPEAHGEAQRSSLAAARAAAKTEERALWKVVDPDGTLISDMKPVTAAERKAYGNLPMADAATLTPAEQTFRDLAKRYGNGAPFTELQSFKTNLREAMGQELSTNGRTPAYRRMSQLMDGVYGSINATIAGRVAEDNAAVSAGTMAPEDTIGRSLQQQRDQFLADKNAAATGRVGVLGSPGGGPAAPAGLYGAAQSTGRQPGGNASPQGIPGEALPNFDEAARQRLAAANTATKNRVTTFDKGPIGKILQPGQTSDTFKLQDSLVPQKSFVRGPTGGETIDAYRKANGSEDALQGVIADSLPKDKNGNVDPAQLAKWQSDYGPALSRLAPGFTRNFQDAATATETMGKIAALRKSSMNDYEKSAFGRIIGAQDPTTVERVVGGMFGRKTAVQDFRKLADEAARDKTGQATLGLRRAIVDHIEQRFLKDIASGNEKEQAIKAAAFQDFVRKQGPVLSQVFKPEEMNTFRAIAQDIARSNQSVVNKVPGPGTAQDILPHMKAAAEHKETLLGKLWKTALVAREGAEATGIHEVLGVPIPLLGPVLAIGSHLKGSLRDAGMAKVADLLKEGLLDPEIGRALIMKASSRADQGSQRTLTNALRRLSVLSNSTAKAPSP